MELYIRIKNGQPFEHPIFGDNFRQAFPDVDVNNLPAEFARFERVERPTLGMYEVMTSETAIYELIDGIWKDVWHKRDMTTEEKVAKQQAAVTLFNTRDQAENWSAWILDEATCTMIPPIARPEADQAKLNAGIYTMWCGADNNWKDASVRPEGQYKFDFLAWNWVAI
jgi:hypothetical protein